MDRLLATTGPVDLEPLAADETLAGAPAAGSRALTTVGEVEVGVWEMTPGTATDTEVDEVFVVLSGSATITFEDGERLPVGPGAVVRLHEGERTTWAVHSTLRKVYVS